MKTTTVMHRIKTFLSNWPAIWTLPAALCIWFASPHLLRAVDPVAGCFDAGVLQVLLFAAMGVFVADFVAWLLIKISWPTISNYVDLSQMSHDWYHLDPKTRFLCAISIFGLHFLGFIFLCRLF